MIKRFGYPITNLCPVPGALSFDVEPKQAHIKALLQSTNH
jgi:hypothetical protein